MTARPPTSAHHALASWMVTPWQVRRNYHSPPGAPPAPPVALLCTEDPEAVEALAVAYSWVWSNVMRIRSELG